MSQRDEEAINRWSGAAPYWEKHREVIREMFAPITEALVNDAEVTAENTVLDVGMGPGEPALSIAKVVGPGGRVCGIDPIPEMVAAARQAAQRLSLKSARFEVAFADKLPFPPNTFDAAVSRLGVMFFPSPVDGVREMLRVLKPGKKLAFAVWHFAESNPFHYTLARVVERYVASPPLPPDALDAFRFATPGKLLEVLAAAGAIGPSERLFQFSMKASVSVEDFWTLRWDISEKLREKLGTLSREQMAEVKRQAIDTFRPYATDDGISFPAEVLIVSGRKS